MRSEIDCSCRSGDGHCGSFEGHRAREEWYAQMAIPDCNVAIAPAIEDDLHFFLERANKWP
uniref:Uncharacterized protein n=1 Tax=Romanomermis culicivorax TaxID=13658 RepID=A0A915HKG0_ROMCU